MKFLTSIWNTWFYQWTLPLKIASLAVLVVVLALIVGALKSCGRSQPKLDEQQIQRGEAAVKQRNDAELKQVLAESDARVEVIEGNVANAEHERKWAVEEAKHKYDDWTTDQLAEELERRK